MTKKLAIVIAGSGQIRDIEIQAATTVGDVLHQLNLDNYLLSNGPKEAFYANSDTLYDKVNDGSKLFASTRAEVGRKPWSA